MTIDDTLVARGDEWTQWWLGWSGNRDQRLTATGSPPPPLNPRLHGKTLRTPVVQKNPEEELGVVQDLLWNLPPNGRIVEGWLLRQLPQFLGVMVVICFKIMFVGSTFCFFVKSGRTLVSETIFWTQRFQKKNYRRLEAAGKDITQKNSLGPLNLFLWGYGPPKQVVNPVFLLILFQAGAAGTKMLPLFIGNELIFLMGV